MSKIGRKPTQGGREPTIVGVQPSLEGPLSLAWYTGLLGMADDTHLRNAALPFPGAFVRAGASQIHLMELPNLDPVDGRPPHGGRDRHVAVTVAALGGVVARLEAAAWLYTMSASGRRALFVRDPDGNAVVHKS